MSLNSRSHAWLTINIEFEVLVIYLLIGSISANVFQRFVQPCKQCGVLLPNGNSIAFTKCAAKITLTEDLELITPLRLQHAGRNGDFVVEANVDATIEQIEIRIVCRVIIEHFGILEVLTRIVLIDC